MKTVIALPTDTHCGSTLGLIRPEPYQLEDGGTYHPNRTQKLIGKKWEQDWKRVGELRKGGRLIVGHAGDAIEGAHHDMRQVVTTNLAQQKTIHIECMEWGLKLAGGADKLYYIAGTYNHAGTSESEIGRDLDAEPSIPDSRDDKHDGRYSWYHLRLDVDGIILDIAHQGAAPGGRVWTTESALMGVIKSAYFQACEAKQKPTRYYIRAHKHCATHAAYSRGMQIVTDGFILPAYQAITEYSNRVAHVASIGMLIIVIEDDGRTWFECDPIRLDVERTVKI